MKYLEDCLSEQLIDELTLEIQNVCDEEDDVDTLVISVLSDFDDDEQAMELLEFIRNSSNLNSDNIVYMTIKIYNKYHNIK